MIVEGRAWKFGDHVDTDLIIPARYLNLSDKKILAEHCFEDLRPDFASGVRKGDIMFAGVNFGCGSSREHAPWAMKAAGVGGVVAKSFARIFYRNAFNIGLPVLESEEASDQIVEGDEMRLDFATGEIMERHGEKRFLAKPVPEFMRAIIEAGGLVEYVKRPRT